MRPMLMASQRASALSSRTAGFLQISVGVSDNAAAGVAEQSVFAHGSLDAVQLEPLAQLPTAVFSPGSLLVRLIAIFIGERELAPRASQLRILASEAKLLLVVAANSACTRFWKLHVATRSSVPALQLSSPSRKSSATCSTTASGMCCYIQMTLYGSVSGATTQLRGRSPSSR